jgi:hypothetical protein
MNNWSNIEIQEILAYHTPLSDEKIEILLSVLNEHFSVRRMAITPIFLSDEMYEAIKEHSPYLGYNEASKIYTSAINGHLKIT